MESTWNLLIVDDSQADRTIYRRYLSQDPHQNYTIFEANCAEKGLALCQHQRFDVMLLDLQLPDMSGLQVLDRVKVQHPETSVIMLTAYGDERIAVQAMKGGARDYLIKDSLRGNGLQRTVRTVVQQVQLEQQLHKNQARQSLLIRIALRIRQSLDLASTLETAVTEVRRLLQCDRVLAYQFAADMSGQIIAESVGEVWTPTLDKEIYDTYFKEQGAKAYCDGRQQLVNDVYGAELDPCHIALLEQFEVKASLVTPILIRGEQPETNQLWGLLAAHHCSEPRKWQADEIQILEELAVHLAIAIQQAELLERTQAALEKEKALTAFKSQIIATVSHEYNAPLTAIQAAAATLQAHYQTLDVATQARFLDIIEQKSRHLSTLVNDMLMVNQTELSELKLQLVNFPLDDFLGKLMSEQQMMATDQHHFKLKIRGDLEGFAGDRGLLRQVFGNLLSNAVKYSPMGGDIRVQLTGEATQIICQVKDEGIGIPEQDQGSLFQPFCRGSNVGAITGTGLGLHIARVAVELHNGSIEASSRIGQGSCFTVRLPKKQPLQD